MTGLRNWCRAWFMLVAASMLVACSGGGDSDQASAAPAATPPVITVQPADAQATVGANALFTASAQGSAITWAWQRSTDGGVTWTAVGNGVTASADGATTQLAVVGVNLGDTNSRFRAIASSAGAQTLSSAAILTVSSAVVPASISVQPMPQRVSVGGSVSFAVTAAGSALQYQWQSSRDDSNWVNVANATAPTLVLQGLTLEANGTRYRVVVSNSGGSVTSTAAELTVVAIAAAPAFTLQPLAASVTTPNAANFTVEVSGQPNPTLQWQRGNNGGSSFVDLAGATGNSYSTGATALSDNGAIFRVVATNSAGSVTSAAVGLNVAAAPAAPIVTEQPQDVRVVAGQVATLNVTVSGTPAPNLQWQLSSNGGASFSNINGATGRSYSLQTSLADNGNQYRVVATNSVGSANSRAALLTVQAPASGLDGRAPSVWARRTVELPC